MAAVAAIGPALRATAEYAWHIGIGIAVVIYAAAAYRDREYQRRIPNDELLPFSVMTRYAWMLPRTPKLIPRSREKPRPNGARHGRQWAITRLAGEPLLQVR